MNLLLICTFYFKYLNIKKYLWFRKNSFVFNIKSNQRFCWKVNRKSGAASVNTNSQWSKQKACFARATRVWLAVNHNTSVTPSEWVRCSKRIPRASELGSCQSNLCHSWSYARLQKSKDSLKACFENVNIHLYFVSVILSCLFIEALWSPAGKGLNSWLSCMWCFLVF